MIIKDVICKDDGIFACSFLLIVIDRRDQLALEDIITTLQYKAAQRLSMSRSYK